MGLDQQTLLSLMSFPGEISDTETKLLEEVLEKHPYFQLGQSLLAKAKHDQQAPDAYQALSRAAVSVPDRRLLRQLFYDNLRIDPNGTSRPTTNASSSEDEQKLASAPQAPVSSENYFSSLAEDQPSQDTLPSVESDEVYNELEENLRKLRESKNRLSEEEKKKIADSGDEDHVYLPLERQLDLPSSTPFKEERFFQEKTYLAKNQSQQSELIDQFISSGKETQIRAKADQEHKKEIDLSTDSTAVSDNIISENLADIYLRQGKKDKALEIYQKLIWKFPEKKSYFAAKIDTIKSE